MVRCPQWARQPDVAGALLFGCALLAPAACHSYVMPVGPPHDRSAGPPGEEPDAGPPEVAGDELAGTWVGDFACASRTGGLTLTMEIRDVATFKPKASPPYSAPSPIFVNAVLAFVPAPGAPSDPAGAYTMTGSFVARTGTLHPVECKKRPPDGRMVGLAGDISRDGTTFSGTVDGEGCGRFSLRKTPPR